MAKYVSGRQKNLKVGLSSYSENLTSLEVIGSAVFSGESSGELVRISQIGTGPALIVEDSANPDTTPFAVTTDGRVAIGLGPSGISTFYKLEVDGNGNGGGVRFVSGGQGDLIFSHSNLVSNIRAAGSVQLGLGANGEDAIRINLNNNVGIGTTVPTSKLYVVGDGYFTGVITASNLNVSAASSFAQLYVSGISTLAANGGITTTGGDLYVGGDLYIADDLRFDEFTARNANVTGITTLGVTTVTRLTAQSINSSGIVTGSTFRPSSGYIQSPNGTNAFYIYDGTGNVAFQGTIGASQINNASGYKVIGFAGTDITFENDARIGKNAYILGVTTSLGGFVGNLTGIAASATQLVTPRTFEITGDVVASAISFDGTGNVSLAATIQPNSVGLGTDTFGDYVKSISGTVGQIDVTGGTGEGSTPVVAFSANPTIGGNVTIGNDLQVNNNLNVNGNITIGGTSAYIIVNDFRVKDGDIVLGFTTNGSGQDISNDTTANHGGIAVASTEGNPLVQLFIAGIETTPATYKKIMWFKAGAFAGLNTDAWLSNYAIGIGSTQFPSGTRLAAGSVQFTENDLAVVRNINASGIITGTLANTLTLNTSGTGLSGSTIYNNSGATTFTVTSNATSNNTPSTIVARDASGNFSAGTITANLTGTASTASFATTAFNLSDAANITTGTINSARLSGTYNIDINGNATYATNAGISTNVIGGIASVTQLNVSGITTLGVASVTNLTVQQVNASGIATFGSFNIGATQVISSARQLQNISSLDATTTATIEAAIQNAPNTFTDLQVTGISTLGITSTTNLTSQQLNVSGISTFSGITTSTSSLFANQLSVSGVSTFSGITTSTSSLFANQLSVVGPSTFVGITTNNSTLFANQLSVAGVSTHIGISTFQSTLFANQLSVVGPSTFAGIATNTSTLFANQFSVAGVTTLASNGGITTTGGDLYIGGDLYVKDDLVFDEFTARNGTLTGSLTSKQVASQYFGELHRNTHTSITVTSENKTSNHKYSGSGSALGYYFDGDESPYLQFIPGKTYRFDQSDASNTNHRLRFYLDANKNQEYTGGVTSSGTPGNSGAYTEIVVTKTTPIVLYYQSDNDVLMGNQIQTVGSFVYLENNLGVGTANPVQQFQVGQTFVVTSNTNVGIGTTNPTAKLDVIGHTELDTLNVSVASTTGRLNVSGLTTTQTLHVSSGSTFRDDITVLLDGTSAIGIGTTAFTPLSGYIVDVRGNVNIGGTLIVNGSNVEDSITSEQGNFVSVATTNLYVSGIATFINNPVDIKAGIAVTGGNANFDNGTLFVDASGNRVGVGTTLPSYTLDIIGSVHATGYTSTRYLTVGTGSSEYTFPDYDGVNGAVLKTDGNGNLDWVTNSALRQSTEITAGAGQTNFNVTYTPGLVDVFLNGVKLASTDYVGTSGTSIVLNVSASSGDTLQVVAFSTDSVSTRAILDYWNGDEVGNIYNITDNVGIGVSVPSQLLDVAGDARIRGGLYDNTNSSGSNQQVPLSDGLGGWVWGNVPTAGVSTGGGSKKNVQFHNAAGILGGSNEFNFDYDTSRVGIGTTSPTEKLDVRGNIYVSNISTLGTVKISSGIITASSGVVTYYGDGSGLSNLNASNLSSGVVPSARLSGLYDISISGSVAGDTISVSTATVTNNLVVGPIGSATTFVRATADGNLRVTGITTLAQLVIGTSAAITSVDTDLNSVSGSDDTLASAKAIKTYVDAQITAQALSVQGDSGGALSIDLDSETLTIAGTPNEITAVGSGNSITVGLPDNVTVTNIVTANAGFANTMSYSNTITGTGNTTSTITLYDQLSASIYRSVEYSVQATQGTNYHFTKIIVVSSGTTAYMTEYGTVFNNSSVASYTSDVSGGYIRLRATTSTATTTNYVVNFTANKTY
jgi:hypothetical protein